MSHGIFLSAGFDIAHIHTSNSNKEYFTALHYAANINNKSINTANCAAYISLKGGIKLGKLRSIDGSTCFHLASYNNNILFFEYVLSTYNTNTDIIELLNMPNRDGILCRAIAYNNGYMEIVLLIDQYTGTGSQV